MTEPEDIHMERTTNRAIVQPSEKPKIQDIQDETQDEYRKQGRYKPFDNTVEEKQPEIWIYQELKKQLPEWDVMLKSREVSSYDITLQHKIRKNFLIIEVKTKTEEPDSYINKFENDSVDRSPSIPPDKIFQVLNADYVIWVMNSKFTTGSNSTLSSSVDLALTSSITGINRKYELSEDMFDIGYARTKYLFINLIKHPFKLKGDMGLQKIIEEIRHLK